jgi:hypothetical protein
MHHCTVSLLSGPAGVEASPAVVNEPSMNTIAFEMLERSSRPRGYFLQVVSTTDASTGGSIYYCIGVVEGGGSEQRRLPVLLIY